MSSTVLIDRAAIVDDEGAARPLVCGHGQGLRPHGHRAPDRPAADIEHADAVVVATGHDHAARAHIHRTPLSTRGVVRATATPLARVGLSMDGIIRRRNLGMRDTTRWSSDWFGRGPSWIRNGSKALAADPWARSYGEIPG